MARGLVSGADIVFGGARHLALAAPLIRGEDYPPYKNGLPTYVSLKNQRVARKLKTEFVIK